MPIRRFVFENNFDEHAVILEPVLPLEVTFSEDELEAAKDLAYLEGINEGKKLQAQEIEAQILQIVSSFESQLTHFIEGELDKRLQLQVMAAKLAHTISLKICLTELEKNAVERVMLCLNSATKLLLNRPQVTMFVHPDIVDPLCQHLHSMVANKELKVVSDDTLKIYDCRLDWQDGGAEILLQHTLDQVDDYITQLAR